MKIASSAIYEMVSLPMTLSNPKVIVLFEDKYLKNSSFLETKLP